MISIKDLSKSYGSKVVLENINLNFEKGKVYDILNELLANYIAKKPVYEMEEKYKDYEIKDIKIEKGGLYVTVKD